MHGSRGRGDRDEGREGTATRAVNAVNAALSLWQPQEGTGRAPLLGTEPLALLCHLPAERDRLLSQRGRSCRGVTETPAGRPELTRPPQGRGDTFKAPLEPTERSIRGRASQPAWQG